MPPISLDDLRQQAPFALPIPSDKLAQIKAFVREMAFGAIMDYWEPLFMYGRSGPSWTWESIDSDTFDEHVVAKWREVHPKKELLQTLGYLTSYGEQGMVQLTPAAYALLDEAPPLSVFISYARRESSALALLILARMKAAGLAPFLDITGLEAGDDWSDRLDTEIRNSQYLIAVLGPTSLDSPYVRHEISLAHEQGVALLPLLHNGLTPERLGEMQTAFPEATLILSRQAIRVERETTEDYNSAMVRLLNRFGVTP